MALNSIFDIFRTEAGNMSQTVDYHFGDPIEIEKMEYHEDQSNIMIAVTPPEVETTIQQNDQIDDAFTFTVMVMQHETFPDAQQSTSEANFWTLKGLAQEYAFRLRKNADMIAATANRKTLTLRLRPRYRMSTSYLYGYEYDITIDYVNNCNPLNAS